MATIDNYKIKIEVQGEEKVVDLMDSLDGLQTTLNKTAAAGIAAFSALATSAVRMADDMVDLADATGFSAGKIYQLNAALEASGGKFGDAGGLLKGFSKTLGDVEKGTTETLDALYKLGLSKSEIETLSDEQLFQAVINGLAGMEAGFERNRIAMILTGKAGDAIDWKKMADGTSKAVDPELEKNLQLAADAVGKIEEAFRAFQKVALEAILPILQGIKDINFTAEDAKQVMQVLGALIAGAFAASTIIQIVKINRLIKDLGGFTKAAAAAMAFLTGLSGVGLLAVAASAAAATAAYIALGKAMEGAADEKKELETPAGAGTPNVPGAGRTVGVTPQERELAAAKETTRQMRQKNAEANKYQRLLIDTIGKSQEEANLIKIMADLERDANNQKATIQQQINTELAKGSDANKAIVAELQKQLTEVDKQLGVQKQLRTEEQDRLLTNQKILDAIKQTFQFANVVSATISFAAEEEIRNKVIAGKLTEKQAQRQIEIQKILDQGSDKNIRLQEQLEIAIAAKDDRAIKAAKNAIDINTMETEKAIENANKRFTLEDKLTQGWMAGTVAALQTITEATTPYKQAQDMIASTWNKIGNAIDTFVETGKFKFKDFAASVLQDLAKIILKAQLLKAIQATLGFFNLNIPGFAQGGNVQGNKPILVGEKGPELFVPPSAGKIVPNNQLGAKTQGVATGAVNAPVTNNYITNNISAIDAKGVAQLFAENRKTLLGSVKMAEREMPYMAR